MPSTSGVRLAGTRPPGSFSMLAAKCSTFARLLAATSAASVGSLRSGSSAAAETAACSSAIRSAGSSRNTRAIRRIRSAACGDSGSPASATTGHPTGLLCNLPTN